MPDSTRYPVPLDDEARVQALHDLKILDTPDEERFDGLIRELAESLDAPIAYLALIDAERQWVKAKVGPLATEVAREHAFCSHAILGTEPVVVADARTDSRFASSPLVTEHPSLRFYAGVPIADSATGRIVGTVCIADQKVRELSARELAILEGFASSVAEQVNGKPRVLVAYASQDLDWVKRLITHGKTLSRDGHFDLWSGMRVASGDDRDWKLKDALQSARSVVIFLTEAFLSSDFVRKQAFQLLLQVREAEGVEVLPMLLEPCDWGAIDWLARRTPRSANGDAGSTASEEQVDELFSELVAQLQATLEKTGRMPRAEGLEHVFGAPETVALEELTRAPEGLTTEGPATQGTATKGTGTEGPVADAPGTEAPGTEAPQARVEVKTVAPKVFLSHASEDATAVRELANKLRQAGLDVWLDLDELKPGDNWMASLESALRQSDAFAVYISRVGVERWINREVRVALDRNVKDPQFRVIPILGPGADPERLPSFLAQHQWLDLRSGDSDPIQIQQLVGAILNRPAEVVSLLPPGEAPFRGLAAFDVEHAHLFFGRDRETEELLERLRVAPFLAVVGDSGSGKSSLVRAGLVPALHRGRFDASGEQTWRTLIMRPGKDPFRELTNALPDLLDDTEPAQRMGVREACEKQLRHGTDGLCGCIGALVPAGQRTLLVVDQFEELFTQSEDVSERDRFIDTLLAACDASGDRPVHTVITLRADLFSACFEHPELPEVISGNQYPARAIGRQQLVEVIEKPAAMAGVRLEPGLVEAILHDVGEESASLALLEHTLLQLWNLRLGETLTHQSYESIGRVQGALEHHAEEVFGALAADQQRLAKKLMLRLAVPGKATVSRRQVARDQLIPKDEGGEAAAQVLRKLVDQRLLTVSEPADGEGAGVAEVEVAHEALLRGWTRFRKWLDEDREFLLWRQRMRTARDAWEESGRDTGALLRGGPLAEARRWLEDRSEDLSDAGRTFVAESVARLQFARRRNKVVIGMIASLAVAAGVFGLVAVTQKRQAENNFEVAEMALEQFSEMTEVTGQKKAERPEAVELKRSIALRAIDFYREVRDQNSFSADLEFKEAVAGYRLGNILREQGASAAAMEAYDQAVEALEDLSQRHPGNPRYRHELANAVFRRGYLRRDAGDLVAAEAEFGEALASQRELAEGSSDELPRHVRLFELARTLDGLGVALRWQERWAEAEQTLEEAKTSFERAIQDPAASQAGEAIGRYRQGLAWTLTNLAWLYEGWGERLGGAEEAPDKFASAETKYRAAISILEDLASDQREIQLELAVNYNNLGNALASFDRWDDAKAANDTAVAMLKELALPISEIRDELGTAYLSRGLITYGLAREDEERESYVKALEIYDALVQDPEALPLYRYRRALALQGLSSLGDGNAKSQLSELCRLLPDLPENERKSLAELCS